MDDQFCRLLWFPISGTETFFIAKERIAILIYNTNYDAGPIVDAFKDKKGKLQDHFAATPTMKDDYKKMY